MSKSESESKSKWVFDWGLADVAFVIGVVLLIILFAGEPDLHDAILYWLTNGEIPLPATGDTP